jgi:hypothetical protein
MCYHPLFVFNQFGDLERCALRPRNVHGDDGWRDVLQSMVARYRHKMKRRYFRGDTVFASPEVYELGLTGGSIIEMGRNFSPQRPRSCPLASRAARAAAGGGGGGWSMAQR